MSWCLRQLFSESWRNRLQYRLRRRWRREANALPISWDKVASGRPYGLVSSSFTFKSLGITGARTRVTGRVIQTGTHGQFRALTLEMDLGSTPLLFRCAFHPYGYPEGEFESLLAYSVEVDGTIAHLMHGEMGTPVLLVDCHLVRRVLTKLPAL